ncbi:MAG TPA: hypothetical protein VGM90_10230 [Kofleriaceae bacterium]|jgi:hypothetical protein
MRAFVLASLSFSLLVAGCSNSKNPGQGTDAGDDQPVDAAPTVLTGEVHMLTFPTVHLEPGQEDTKCVLMRLPNAAEIKVHKFHNHLSQQSHHLIVYKDDMDTTEQLEPFKCQPFTGALNSTGMIAPIMITQKQDDLLELPNDVGYTFAATQMIKLEMHYINTQDTAQDANATVEFQVADPTTVHQEANILFIGDADITIPAGQSETLDAFFTVPYTKISLKDSKIFAITGHTHKLGTNMTVAVGTSKTDTAPTSVYAPTPFSWSEPETTRHDPEFSVPDGGGFKFSCSWQNTTNQQVNFGESANNEMCFFWAYYYPSQGAKVCIHTKQFGGANGLDVCCPGDSLCSLVDGFLDGQGSGSGG